MVNGVMKHSRAAVLGVTAPPPRPTFRSALWLASALSVPVFVVLSLIELLVRWLL